MEIHFRAFHSYHPQTYPGRVTLFRPEALPLFRAHDTGLGWGALATGGVEVKIIADTYHELLQEPHVEKLAVQLSASLADAQAKTS